MTQTEKQNVPKLRFPEFGGEWESKALRDFVDSKRKVTYGIVQPGIFVEEGIPLVRGGDYSDGWVPFKQIKRVTSEIDAPYKRSKLRENDILLTIVGANTGTIAKVPDWLDGANITQTTARIAVESGSGDTGYILQCLKSHIGQNEVRKYIKGAAQPGLNLADVEKFRVPAPTLPEQRKIAGFLGAVDEKVAHLSRKKSLLEDYKKGCMQKLFSQKIRFKDDDGKNFPDWGIELVKNLFKSEASRPYQILTSEIQEIGQIPVVDQGKEYVRGFSDKKEKVFSASKIPVIVFGDHTTELKFINFDFVVGADGTKLLTPHKGVTLFFYYALCFYNVEQEGYKRHFGVLKSIELPFPHPAEQRKIADFLSAIDRKIDLVAQELTHARSFKAGLLQQMFV